VSPTILLRIILSSSSTGILPLQLIKMHFLTITLSTLLALSTCISAYKIDQSCYDKGIAPDISAAMTSAFDMATSALAHLNTNPYDQQTNDLIRHLFLAKYGHNPKDHRAKLSKVQYILDRVGRYYNREVVPVDGVAKQSDVVSIL
jgi:hypothetical protein